MRTVGRRTAPDPFAREKRLIMLLNRVYSLNADAVQEVLKQDLDWNFIFQTSAELGTAPLLYYHLKEWKPSGLANTPIMEAFQRQYHLCMANNLHLLHEFDRIAERLTERGIPCIPLKGIALVKDIYPSMALRPMFDIDLLVRRNDASGALETIQDFGFTAHENEWTRLSHPYYYHLHCAKNNGSRAILEMHWSLGERNRYAVDDPQIWARAKSSRFGPYLEMSEDDTLLYLCLHFFKHFLFKRLSWLCDIHEWIRQKEIHWPDVIERARSQRLATFLLYTLAIYETFYETRLPVPLDPAPIVGFLRKRVLDWYVQSYDMFHPMTDNSWIKKRLLAFSSIDRTGDRIKFTWNTIGRDLEQD